MTENEINKSITRSMKLAWEIDGLTLSIEAMQTALAVVQTTQVPRSSPALQLELEKYIDKLVTRRHNIMESSWITEQFE